MNTNKNNVYVEVHLLRSGISGLLVIGDSRKHHDPIQAAQLILHDALKGSWLKLIPFSEDVIHDSKMILVPSESLCREIIQLEIYDHEGYVLYKKALEAMDNNSLLSALW